MPTGLSDTEEGSNHDHQESIFLSEHNKEAQRDLKEIIRLAKEADQRFEAGEYQAAKSSLAAIPSMHMAITEVCEKNYREEFENTEEAYRPGNYL